MFAKKKIDWMPVKICLFAFFIAITNAAIEDFVGVPGQQRQDGSTEVIFQQSSTEGSQALESIEDVAQSATAESEAKSVIELTTDEPRVTIMIPLDLQDEDFDNISGDLEAISNIETESPNLDETNDISTTTDSSEISTTTDLSEISTTTATTTSDDTPSLLETSSENDIISSTSSPSQSVFSATAINEKSSTTSSIRPKINDGEVVEINRIAKKIVNLFTPNKLKRKRKLNLEQVLRKLKGNRRIISHDVEPMGNDIPIPEGWKLIQV